MAADPLFSPNELAEQYSVSADTIRKWISSGELKAINLSADKRSKRPRWAVRLSDLEDFFRTRSTGDVATRRAEYRRKPYERVI